MRLVVGFAILLAVAMPLTVVAQEPAPSTPTPISNPASSTILVPAGTEIPVHVVGSISSGSAKVDDVFQIQVAHDVTVNDMIVFRKGAGGQGHIIDGHDHRLCDVRSGWIVRSQSGPRAPKDDR